MPIVVIHNGFLYIGIVALIGGKAKFIGKKIAPMFWMPPDIKLLPTPKNEPNKT